MTAVPYLAFLAVAGLAISFVTVPVFRAGKGTAALLLFASIALFMLAIGGGSYLLLGRPHLAERAAQGLNTRDVNGLVPFLIARVRQHPTDARAWRYLGEAYVAANDPGEAAQAYAHAIALGTRQDPTLDSAYGEALVMDNAGAVPAQAEAAFQRALSVDPHNLPARFYLGMARLARHDIAGTIALWQSLLADIPATAPLHQVLVDRLAMLKAQSGNGAPDPRAMVAMLAARLRAHPNDALGWVRLIRAYTVLGEKDKAETALASARKAFANNKDAQNAFDAAAKALNLN